MLGILLSTSVPMIEEDNEIDKMTLAVGKDPTTDPNSSDTQVFGRRRPKKPKDVSIGYDEILQYRILQKDLLGYFK